MKDHPRLRGEKELAKLRTSIAKGSPPLTRGKVWNIAWALEQERITPAYAGKSLHFGRREEIQEDHPRLRGEKRLSASISNGFPGSPPLTRGKGVARFTSLRREGITPAYAGKSKRQKLIYINQKDHPRLRGEKLNSIEYKTFDAGSPPLTRGKAHN